MDLPQIGDEVIHVDESTRELITRFHQITNYMSWRLRLNQEGDSSLFHNVPQPLLVGGDCRVQLVIDGLRVVEYAFQIRFNLWARGTSISRLVKIELPMKQLVKLIKLFG